MAKRKTGAGRIVSKVLWIALGALVVAVLAVQGWFYAQILWWRSNEPASSAFMQARLERLSQADECLARVRVYLRLAERWAWLTSGQYEHVAAMVAEIGRLLGGWRKVTGTAFAGVTASLRSWVNQVRCGNTGD